MIVYVQQCAAVEGNREDGLELGYCRRTIKGGTTFLSVIHSASYVLYKKRQRGLREPLVRSKDSYSDGIRVKRR